MVRETAKVLKGEEVAQKLLEGSYQIASAVGTTLGPYGRNVALTKIYNNPHITKDGVTVAKGISLEDPVENIAVQVIKEAADKTAKEAGDGTSSTTILAATLVKNLFNYLKDSSLKYSTVKKELEDISEEAIEYVKSVSTSIDNRLEQVALVSSNNDEEVAKIVADAFEKIGVNGVVTVVPSTSRGMKIETTDGIRLDRSHVSNSMVEKIKETYQEANILVTNLTIETDVDAVHLLQIQEESGKPLLIICNDMDKKALEIMTYNKKARKVPVVVIRAPFIADARREACKDLAIATGATFVEKESGWDIKSVSAGLLGTCDSFEIDLKETSIVGRHGKPEEIEERISFYQDKISTDDEGLKGNYEKRLNLLNGGAAVIYVGGTNEIEVLERKDRVDDTVKAVKSALEQGVVRGGGLTYIDICDALKNDSEVAKLFYNGLMSIPTTILKNKYGFPIDKENCIISSDFIELTHEVEKSNVLDPTKVIINTIENAVGAAITLAGTSCVIIKREE